MPAVDILNLIRNGAAAMRPLAFAKHVNNILLRTNKQVASYSSNSDRPISCIHQVAPKCIRV